MPKTVVLGVTGCVAAYKACEVVRGLQKAGVRVKVVMTESGTRFVNPAQFRALTREPVAVGLFDDAPGDPIHHISLAKEADALLIAPCTANVMAKMAHGIADDLLTTTALATRAPIIVAPAMNANMYEHAATQANMITLAERGVRFVDAGSGYLACGDEGKGRLADVGDIVAAALDVLENEEAAKVGNAQEHSRDLAGGSPSACGPEDAQAHARDLAGKKVLITAGPTVEPIDAVRFISNPSTGKMGFALAEAAAQRGAQVEIVSGPVSLADPAGVHVVRVKTALQMLDAADERFGESDIAIFSAAVSDYRPANAVDRKLKKGADDERLATISLVPNPDILATMAARKRAGQVVVGFAAETADVEENARAKLSAKHADMIVGNRVGAGLGFASDDNEAVLVTDEGARRVPRMSKRELAHEILDAALNLL